MGGEQQDVPGDVPPGVDIDPQLESDNLPRNTRKAVRELLDVLRSINFPGKVRLGDAENPVYVRKGDRAGLTIYVSPDALAAQKRQILRTFGPEEGTKRWSQYRLMVVATHETVHNVHLKQLEKEAGELGLTFDQHLANEIKRVAKFLNRNRRLKKYVAYLYNQGTRFKDNETQYFEFIRMLVENETMGRVTENATLPASEVAKFMDDIDRRWLTNLIDTIIQGLSNLASRIIGTRGKDAEYLINTTKLLRQLNRDLLNPPKKERVATNYVEPKQEFVAKESKADTRAAENEIASQSALSNQSKKFLEEYAKELKIKVPTYKHKYTVFDEKTRKYREAYSFRPVWKKEEYVEAIKAKLKELGKKPKDILGAAPMRFRTEYALKRFDEKVGGDQRGVLKGIAADKNNTIPWQNLKAKIQKNTSRAEAEWILPTLEPLVRNGRVDVDQASKAIRALAESKVQVEVLDEANSKGLTKEEQQLNESRFVKNAVEIENFINDGFHKFHGQLANIKSYVYEYIPIHLNKKNGFVINWESLAGGLYSEGPYPKIRTEDGKDSFERVTSYYEKELNQKESWVQKKYQEWQEKYIDILANYGSKTLQRELSEAEIPQLRELKELHKNHLKTYSENLEQKQTKYVNAAFGVAVMNRYYKLKEAGSINRDKRASVRFSLVNPKPIEYLQNLREILVKAPGVSTWEGHYPEKNVIGFGRMYSTTKDGKRGTFLFEVQSDVNTFMFGDPEQVILKAEATEKDLLKFFDKGFENENYESQIVEVSSSNYNPWGSGTQILPEDLRDDFRENQEYVLKGDILLGPKDEPQEIAARKIGENLYHVFGLAATDLAKELGSQTSEYRDRIRISVPKKPDGSDERFKPLVDSYESLVLKNAINDAISNGEDFIAITDAETAAMTESHDTVKEGMRVHYDPQRGSLHNLARKLTGDAGTGFNDGPSIARYEATRFADDRSGRYPHMEVTGVAYSLDNLKANLEASPINDILGAAVPSDRPVWLKPDGKTIDVDEDTIVGLDGLGNHSKAALEYLQENEPDAEFLKQWKLLDPFEKTEQNQRVVEEMLQKGWVRVVGDGFNIYFEGNPNQTQLDALFESAIEDEARLIQDLTGIGGKARSKVVYEPPTSGLIGAAMPRRGYLTTRKREISTTRLPDSLEDLALVRYFEGGSHMVGLYEDTDGLRFIVKTGQSREQFENEIAAENVYRVLGYPVADSKLIQVDGQPAKIAEYIEDGLSLKEFREKFSNEPGEIKKVYDQLADGMLIDAFLFNYDSIGVNAQDNVLIQVSHVPTEDGEGSENVYTIYRIDSGGTFDTKAFEEVPRNEPFYYDSMKVMQKNYPYLNLTPSDMVAQLSDLVLNSDAVLNAVPQRLQAYMARRLQYMADQLSAVDVLTPVTGINEQQTEQFFERLKSQLDAVQVARDDRGRLINAATGKLSQISGLDGKFVPKSEFRYRLERTPLFKAWFGDWENSPAGRATSKMLDEAGEPKLMYHGTGSYLQRYSDLYKDEVTNAVKTPSYIRRFGINRFKGTWVAENRSWAEAWSTANNPEGEYHEQVVFPMYVKSTKPFDPREQANLDRLLSYLKEQGQVLEPQDEYSVRNGLLDWQMFEGVFDKNMDDREGNEDRFVYPDPQELRNQGVSEETIRRRFASKYPYRTLKAVVDLGFDGIWVQESLDKPELYRKVRWAAQGVVNDPQNQEYLADYRKALGDYKANARWNFLSFRRDGVKSAMNSGLFSSVKDPAEFRRSAEAQKLEAMVTVDGPTGRNKLVYKGQTLYSTDSPAALAAYAVASPSALSRHNIAKIKLRNQPNTFFMQQRTAPSQTSVARYPVNDILGAAEVRPRRFGQKLSKVLSKTIMDTLRNKNYETLPDTVALGQAEDYFKRNGLEKSAIDVLSDDSPVRAGVQEALGMMVIRGYREKIKDEPEAAGRLASFVDEFLEKSTGTGRALRAYRFISMLGPEGLQAMYYKKARKRDAVMRERFQDFIRQASAKLEPLSQDAVERALKEMENVLRKATKLAKTNTRKIAAKTTMTMWQQFADQVGKGMTDKINEQLAAMDQAENQEGGEEGKMLAEAISGAKPRTINQEASAALRKIRNMIDNLAREQGNQVKEVDINANPDDLPASDEQIAELRVIRRKQNTIERLSDLLSLWPKAFQAWGQIKDTIRQEIAINPKLAPLFENYLSTAMEQPFTSPQIRNLMKATDIDMKELIRDHFRRGTLGKQSSDLAKLFMEQANLGSLGMRTEGELAQAQGMGGREGAIEVEPTIAEKLESSLAKKIEDTVKAEATKILTNLIQNQADRRLEPSLTRFLDRLVKLTSYGLLDSNNIELWNQFAEQEGLTNPKLAEEIYNLAKEAEAKPEGFQRNMSYQKAMRALYQGTEMNKWDFVMTWWYTSILSGSDTQGANALGNLSQSVIVMLPELAWAAAQGKGGKQHMSAVLRGMAAGWDDFFNIFKTGGSFTKQIALSLNDLKATDTGEVLAERGKGIGKAVGKFSVFIRRIMSGVDSFFYNANKEFYLYKYAYDLAYNDGKSGLTKKQAEARALEMVARDSNSFKSAGIEAEREGFEKGSRGYRLRVAEILDQRLGQDRTESGEKRTVDTQGLLNESIAAALNNTYQQEPRGFLGSAIQAINILAAKQPETRFVIPFTRIVGNVWNMSIDMSGYGLVRYYGFPTEKLIKRRLGQWDSLQGTEKEMLRTRALLGLLFVGMASALAAFGYDKDYEKAWFRINGSGPDDPQARQALMKTGWKQWSIKVGNKYWSYLPTPLAIPLALIGEMADNYHYKKTGARALFNVSHAGLTRALLVPFDMMFLSGLSDVFKMTDSSQPEQAEARAKAFVSRLGSSLLIPNTLRDIDQRLLPGILDTLGFETNWGKRTARAGMVDGIFIANTPILRQIYGKPQVDVLGNQIEVTSRLYSTRRPDPLVETLALKNAFPSPARKELLLGLIPMDENQFLQYRLDRGAMMNKMLNTPEMIQQLRESNSFVAQEIVKQVSSEATKTAKDLAIQRMVESNDPRIQKLETLGDWLENQKD